VRGSSRFNQWKLNPQSCATYAPTRLTHPVHNSPLHHRGSLRCLTHRQKSSCLLALGPRFRRSSREAPFLRKIQASPSWEKRRELTLSSCLTRSSGFPRGPQVQCPRCTRKISQSQLPGDIGALLVLVPIRSENTGAPGARPPPPCPYFVLEFHRNTEGNGISFAILRNRENSHPPPFSTIAYGDFAELSMLECEPQLRKNRFLISVFFHGGATGQRHTIPPSIQIQDMDTPSIWGTPLPWWCTTASRAYTPFRPRSLALSHLAFSSTAQHTSASTPSHTIKEIGGTALPRPNFP